MKRQLPTTQTAKEYILADSYSDTQLEAMGNIDYELLPVWQSHPSVSTLGTMLIGEYDTANTTDGRRSHLSAVSYANGVFDTGTGYKLYIDDSEMYSFQKPMVDSGDGLTFESGYPDWINDTGSYEIEIRVNGTPVTTGFTIDYPAGTVTFSADHTGDNVQWTGFWAFPCATLAKDYTDVQRGYNLLSSTLYPVMPLNHDFRHWTSSTQPTSWTIAGTAGRGTAAFKAGYDLELTATVGLTKASQQLALASTVDQITAFAVARTTNLMCLRVSMDAGVSYNYVDFTADSTSASKWITLIVQSKSYTTNAPIIEFMPQLTAGSVTSVARVALIGAINGGLI